ncbi:hypothetical protein PFICI_05989 [Pestalotiopsis fici W106-1]|uniref:Uncharacterized protein n=1 Tax=Pestalotiopsis fici (strain W106-1 / CGMCC3.15140) TaxID=1229662 RepID=W3X6G1_PESFW|nr:uncharacterized protein PFICI_05989 [Pestalotiopsis fici W106-1]ETS80987.1 hypothetical protein PFICI_05989 [Pestalotiopsis fici W106-1]
MILKIFRRHTSPSFIITAIVLLCLFLTFFHRHGPERAYTGLNEHPVEIQHDTILEGALPSAVPKHGDVEISPTLAESENSEAKIPSISVDIISEEAKALPAGDSSSAQIKRTTTLVTGHTKDEDVSWLRESFRGPEYLLKIYSVDGSNSKDLHTPMNKGRETMPFLTYIIDNYNSLSDINIFLHPHRYAWHSRDTLIPDTVELIHRLNTDRVARLGYINLRCRWSPGCPVHMDTGSLVMGNDIPEQTIFGPTFRDIFGADAEMPALMGGTCCSQFAVMRETVQSVPLERWRYMREWIRTTDLDDGMVGRVFESLWQYIFLGEAILCPREHLCYCDTYGLCFGGATGFDQNEWLLGRRKEMQGKVKWLDEAIKEAEKMSGKPSEGGAAETKSERKERITMMQEEKSKALLEVERLSAICEANVQRAFENGNDPIKRAKEMRSE